MTLFVDSVVGHGSVDDHIVSKQHHNPISAKE